MGVLKRNASTELSAGQETGYQQLHVFQASGLVYRGVADSHRRHAIEDALQNRCGKIRVKAGVDLTALLRCPQKRCEKRTHCAATLLEDVGDCRIAARFGQHVENEKLTVVKLFELCAFKCGNECLNWVRLLDYPSQPLRRVFEAILGNRADDGFLAWKIVIEMTGTDFGFLAYIRNTRATETVSRKTPFCDF